jgi:histidine ammonia-lyase
VTAAKALTPGHISLTEWRAIYCGCPCYVDPVARADVEAGKAALAEAGPLPWPVTGREGPTVAEFLGGSGDPLPAGVVRLLMALKIGVLGQGLTGAGWPLIETLSECLRRDILPAIPVDGLSDRMAHAHLFALVTGTGEVLRENLRRPAAKALKKAGLAPCKLNAGERQALLSGTSLSLAFALAGLFEAERVFRNALLAGALSAAAGRLPGAILHPRVHKLLRQPGQQEVAHVLRVLASAPATHTLQRVNGASPADGRQFAAEMGACLDLLRQAAATLERAANAAASAGQLVFWQTDELVDGLDDLSSLTFAADQVALALREIGALAERRIGALAEAKGPAKSGAAGDIMAAGFSRDINDRARPTGFAGSPAG